MMDLSELAKKVAQFGAPLLGTVLAGPAGGALGQLIANEFGDGKINDEKDVENLVNRINTDPAARVKLFEIESTQKIELQKLIIAAEKQRMENETSKIELANENTKNARENNYKTGTYYPQFLSTFISFGFMLSIYWIAAYSQDKSDHDVLYMLLGVIGTSFNVVVNYWLGASMQHPIYRGKK